MKVFKGFQKGVNLGGWISQFAEYNKDHFETFIMENDIRDIAQLGFDHVRVPVDYNVLENEDGEIIEEGFQYLKNCYEWCLKYDLNMLIDLHECYGYSFDPLKKDMDRKKFFYDDELQERFFKLWEKIAETFKDASERVAFEPLNEVVLAEVVDAWNTVIKKYITRIRDIAKENYIVIGGVCYNNVMSVPLLEKQDDDKIVYNFHCYEPMIFSHQGAYWVENMPSDFRIGYPRSVEEYREYSRVITKDLGGAIFSENAKEMGEDFFVNIFKPAIEKAEKDDVSLYCGEYGVIDLANNEDKIRWLKDIHGALKQFGIGRALWNYKEKDFGFVDERFSSIKEEFMKCL